MKKILVSVLLLMAHTVVNAQTYDNIVTYSSNGTVINGIKIKTNLPFTSGTQMPTIDIMGYCYGNAAAVGLQIGYYLYGTTPETISLYNSSVSSYGSFTPNIIVANEDGKVVFFMDVKATYLRFRVSAFAKGRPEDISANYQGWTVVDEALTGTNQGTLVYRNNFAGSVNLPGTGVWNSLGNVGVGTAAPASKLHVVGDLRFGTNGTYTDLKMLSQTALTGYNQTNIITPVTIPGSGNAKAALYLKNAVAGGTTRMDMLVDGNVGIGTTTVNDTYKLMVNGSIRAKEIKVETGWADYVFDKGYKLRSLSEVAQFISDNHHLPDVPSAAEVEKNGVLLGQTNEVLLRKIEELTLYLIEKDKEMKVLIKKISKLERPGKKRLKRYDAISQ